MVSRAGKMNGTPKSTHPLLPVAKHFFFSKSRRPTALKFLGTEDVLPVERITLMAIPIIPPLLRAPPTPVSYSNVLFLIFHLSCCTRWGICELFGSAPQWDLSAPPIKINWMNHVHRLHIQGMGACVSLVIFQPVFQFQPSLTEGQTPLETQSSHKLHENRHPNRGNWQRNSRKGSRTGSTPMRPEYTLHTQTHRKPGFTGSAAHGDTWFNDKTCPCMSGGGPAPCFPSCGCMNGKVRITLSIPRGTLHCSALENVKISTPAKEESTHACWCDLEEPQGETEMCTPSSSHLHVTWLALLPNLAQQDSKFRSLLPKSHSLSAPWPGPKALS